MKPLLQTNDPRYLRRLVRECNGLTDGFYAGGLRYGRARLASGRLQVRRPVSYVDPNDPRYQTGPQYVWNDVDAENLSDAYGRTVCASRRQS